MSSAPHREPRKDRLRQSGELTEAKRATAAAKDIAITFGISLDKSMPLDARPSGIRELSVKDLPGLVRVIHEADPSMLNKDFVAGVLGSPEPIVDAEVVSDLPAEGETDGAAAPTDER